MFPQSLSVCDSSLVSVFHGPGLFKSTAAQLFCRPSLSLDLCDVFLMIRLRLSIFSKDTAKDTDDIISGSVIPICYLTGDVHFDHLVKVVSAMFLHYKVTVFLFVMSEWKATYLILNFSTRLLFSQQAHDL